MAVAKPNPDAEDKKETPSGERFVRCRHCGKLINKTSLIDGGGVRVDGGVISDKGLKLGAGTYVLQVGKRKFARVTLS